jgi:hypothetical protein
MDACCCHATEQKPEALMRATSSLLQKECEGLWNNRQEGRKELLQTLACFLITLPAARNVLPIVSFIFFFVLVVVFLSLPSFRLFHLLSYSLTFITSQDQNRSLRIPLSTNSFLQTLKKSRILSVPMVFGYFSRKELITCPKFSLPVLCPLLSGQPYF